MKKYLVSGLGSLLMTALSLALVLQATASHASTRNGAAIDGGSIEQPAVRRR
jgi:hypothetical protein